MKSLSNEERKLLMIQFFDFLSFSLVGVFVTVFFFNNSDLKTTMLYNAINMAFFTLFYALSGWILRKISSGLLMKISFLVSALFYFLLFFLRERSVAFILPLGIISGFSGAAFWSAFNLNQYILSHSGRRVEYFGWGGALMNLAFAIGPVVGGWLISLIAALTFSLNTGYAILFLLDFIIMALAVILIGKLPSHEAPTFSYAHLLQHKRSIRWKLVLVRQGIFGLYDIAIGTVTGVLFYLVVRQEATLGFLLTIGSFIAMAGSLISIRILKKFSRGFWIGAIGSSFAILWFAVLGNIWGIWVYLVLMNVTAPFLGNAMSVEYFNAIDSAGGSWQHKYHMMLEQPIVFCTMRTVSYLALFIFLHFGDEISIARIWLFILPILPIAIALFFRTKPSTISSDS